MSVSSVRRVHRAQSHLWHAWYAIIAWTGALEGILNWEGIKHQGSPLFQVVKTKEKTEIKKSMITNERMFVITEKTKTCLDSIVLDLIFWTTFAEFEHVC